MTDYSLIAQSVERRTVNPQVAGSSPARGAKYIKKAALVNCTPKVGHPSNSWGVFHGEVRKGI